MTHLWYLWLQHKTKTLCSLVVCSKILCSRLVFSWSEFFNFKTWLSVFHIFRNQGVRKKDKNKLKQILKITSIFKNYFCNQWRQILHSMFTSLFKCTFQYFYINLPNFQPLPKSVLKYLHYPNKIFMPITFYCFSSLIPPK
jgi:hypothetical protein